MIRNNKDEIFKKVFAIFLSKNYELVTIRNLEDATGYSRGGIFYYAENKEELFRKIIDYFIFEKQDIKRKMSHGQPITLRDFIEEYLKGVLRTIKVLRSYVPDLRLNELSKAYLALGLQAGNHYDGWEAKIYKVFEFEVLCWEKVIKQAQQNKEIKSDIDPHLVAEQFRFIFLGLSYSDALYKGINVEHLRDLFMHLYNIIKIK